jgi:hypothetical protein
MDESTTGRKARAARNQSLYRSVNERVKEVNEAFESVLPFGDWVCECANVDCAEVVKLTTEEYESVRAEPVWFLVLPSDSHVVPDVERIVRRTERYWVVEKLGVAADVAEREDARTD